jgi:hypothetical protein
MFSKVNAFQRFNFQRNKTKNFLLKKGLKIYRILNTPRHIWMREQDFCFWGQIMQTIWGQLPHPSLMNPIWVGAAGASLYIHFICLWLTKRSILFSMSLKSKFIFNIPFFQKQSDLQKCLKILLEVRWVLIWYINFKVKISWDISFLAILILFFQPVTHSYTYTNYIPPYSMASCGSMCVLCMLVEIFPLSLSFTIRVTHNRGPMKLDFSFLKLNGGCPIGIHTCLCRKYGKDIY